MAGSCRRCEAPRPDGTVEALFELGWGSNGTICPDCRAKINAIAAQRAGNIAAGVGATFARRWGPGSRTVTIRDLPALAIRSTWVIGPAEKLEGLGANEVWQELGDGAYLMTMSAGDQHMHAAVQVTDGVVEVEPITPEEAALLPGLVKLVEDTTE